MSTSPQDLMRPAERRITAALTARCAEDPALWQYAKEMLTEPLPDTEVERSRVCVLMLTIQRCCLVALEVGRRESGPVVGEGGKLTAQAVSGARSFLHECASTLNGVDPLLLGGLLWGCALQLDLDQEGQAQLLTNLVGPGVGHAQAESILLAGIELAWVGSKTAATHLGLTPEEYLQRMGLRSL